VAGVPPIDKASVPELFDVDDVDEVTALPLPTVSTFPPHADSIAAKATSVTKARGLRRVPVICIPFSVPLVM
jgi:hypothetical protein